MDDFRDKNILPDRRDPEDDRSRGNAGPVITLLTRLATSPQLHRRQAGHLRNLSAGRIPGCPSNPRSVSYLRVIGA
jgi:hypothetical protein